MMVKRKFPFGRDRDDWFDDIFDDFWSRRWGDIFDEFDEYFRDMRRRMNMLIRDAMSGKLPEPKEGGPYIYGWSFRIGPDGKPVFQEFGNIPQRGITELPGSREPLVDVQETDDEVQVTAEVPGVKKEEIDLEVTGNTLIIKVEGKDRKYYKEVELPAEVDPDSAKASYNNGVLDIQLKKVKPKSKGKKIKIK
ncbi:MAG: Hsp20/alpha crystallin family protein [Thermoplasmata archaeon]|nr:MAG: Hsp20/alpha crystallin family protein [Thermoplasmata archaeon]